MSVRNFPCPPFRKGRVDYLVSIQKSEISGWSAQTSALRDQLNDLFLKNFLLTAESWSLTAWVREWSFPDENYLTPQKSRNFRWPSGGNSHGLRSDIENCNKVQSSSGGQSDVRSEIFTWHERWFILVILSDSNPLNPLRLIFRNPKWWCKCLLRRIWSALLVVSKSCLDIEPAKLNFQFRSFPQTDYKKINPDHKDMGKMV